MRKISFTTNNRSDNLLHIETDLAIINIRVGLHDVDGNQVEAIEIIPDSPMNHEDKDVILDGKMFNRLTLKDSDEVFV